MKKLVFTTAVALALATTAYAADHGHGGGPGPSMGGGMGGSAGGNAGFSGPSPGGGPGGASSSFKGGPSGPTSSSGPGKGQMGGLYNQGRPNMNTYKQGGPSFDKDHRMTGDHNRMGDRDNRHLYNRADQDHDFDRGRRDGDRDFRQQGDRDLRHHGVVRGNFFEHGRHFGFRRFWNGQWVFLNAWDDCTAYAWVHVAPGTWAWAPVDICVG